MVSSIVFSPPQLAFFSLSDFPNTKAFGLIYKRAEAKPLQ